MRIVGAYLSISILIDNTMLSPMLLERLLGLSLQRLGVVVFIDAGLN